MAKRKIEESEIPAFEGDNWDEVEGALQQLEGDTSRIDIYRLSDNAAGLGRPKFLTSYSPGTFNIMLVKEDFGGGKYKYRAVRDRQPVAEGTFEIEGEPHIKKVEQAQPAPASTNDGAPVWATALISRIERLEHGNGNNDLVRSLLELSSNTRSKTLEEIAAMRSLFAPPQSSLDANAITGIVSQVLKMASSFSNNGGGNFDGENGGNNAGIWGVLMQNAPALINKLLSGLQPNAIPATDPNILEKLRNGNAAGLKAPEILDSFSEIKQLLNKGLPYFIPMAANDSDPASAAEVIVGSTPPQMRGKAVEWLSTEKSLEDIYTMQPQTRLQARWWSELRMYLLAMYQGKEYNVETGTIEEIKD